MRFNEQRTPPLFMERDAELYGRDLTQTEFDAEFDELPPSRRFHLLPRTGPDRLSARPAHTAPGALPSSAPGATTSREAA